ncbi:leucine-rich repeat domain-containing protein [Ruminococcus flavefaciens]|uniref:leucine-rich repeat domain-containing protein n=1 Tax=Ruminococcus flavefaciens TaxID=1265 RepID=UPI0026EC341D|nr:leucine-rich repeat domain-containing protein [Ruminococcus flavefaciens]
MKRTIKAIIAATGAAIMCAAPVFTSVSSTPIVNNITASASYVVNAFDSFDNNWVPSITGVSNGVTKVNLGHVNYEFDKDAKTATILGIDNADSRIKFPKGINVNGTFYKTVAIANGAFYKKNGQKQDDGKAALKGAALTMVDLNAAIYLETIGDDAFNGCTKLTGSIRLPKTLTSIGARAFRDTAITEVAYTVENRKPVSDLNTIGDDAFYNCQSLTKIYLPPTMMTVGNRAFSWSGITLANFAGPSSEDIIIKSEAFAHCSKLTSIGTDRTVNSSSSKDAFRNIPKANVHRYSSSTSDELVGRFKIYFGL